MNLKCVHTSTFAGVQVSESQPKEISEKLISQIETTTCDQNHVPFGIIDFAKQSANYNSLIIFWHWQVFRQWYIYKMFSGLGEELFKQSWINAELLNKNKVKKTEILIRILTSQN